MVLDIQSKEVIDKISDELKVQPALQIPRQLAEKIQLVYGVNPLRQSKVATTSISDATNTTIFTTSVERRTFITSVFLSVAKDVVNDSVHSRIGATLKGQSDAISLLRLRYEPITADNFNATIVFPDGIELKPDTNVTIINNTDTASIDCAAVVVYYETDPQ